MVELLFGVVHWRPRSQQPERHLKDEHLSNGSNSSFSPLAAMRVFWKEIPGKVFANFPAQRTAENATLSYNRASTACKAEVNRIVPESHQSNQKFRDNEFDIEHDLRCKQRPIKDCLILLHVDRLDILV